METKDVRWILPFRNYKRALIQLEEAVAIRGQRELTNLEKLGMIQAFEFTHELAWNTLKDFLQSRENNEIYGSRDATREAFTNNLIEDGDAWMEMVQSRNLASRTYNERTADEMIDQVQRSYLSQFIALRNRLGDLVERQRPKNDE